MKKNNIMRIKIIASVIILSGFLFINSFSASAGSSTQNFITGQYNVSHTGNLVNSTGYITVNLDVQHINYQIQGITLRSTGYAYTFDANNWPTPVGAFDSGTSATYYYYHSVSATKCFNQPVDRVDATAHINSSAFCMIVQ